MLTIFLSDMVAIPSEATKKNIINRNIFVIPNIVTTNFYMTKHSDYISNPKILYSGRLMTYKGVANLVKGFILLLKDIPEAKLIIVYPSDSSENRLENKLKSLVKINNIKNKVIFVCDPSNEKIIYYFRTSHVTVLASEIENSPLSVLESMASGTPVIGTATGDMTQLLSRLDKNLLLKNNSPLEIYTKLKYFFSLKQSELNKLSNKSKIIVKDHKGDVSVNRFINIIDMLESEELNS
jgi:glycosyltransferase involved in cell wall biosynthesis